MSGIYAEAEGWMKNRAKLMSGVMSGTTMLWQLYTRYDMYWIYNRILVNTFLKPAIWLRLLGLGENIEIKFICKTLILRKY